MNPVCTHPFSAICGLISMGEVSFDSGGASGRTEESFVVRTARPYAVRGCCSGTGSGASVGAPASAERTVVARVAVRGQQGGLADVLRPAQGLGAAGVTAMALLVSGSEPTAPP